jgi:hypothetical protein
MTISEYITEQLSKSNLDRLEDLVRQGIVNDDNFEDIYNEVLKISKVAGLDRPAFDEYFKKHGLSELRWGRGNDAFTELVRLFAKNSNVDTLKEIVTKDGAKSVHAFVSHFPLTAKGEERLMNETQLDELVVTDSIPLREGFDASKLPFKLTQLSVAPLIAEAIKRIHNDESVNDLFH